MKKAVINGIMAFCAAAAIGCCTACSPNVENVSARYISYVSSDSTVYSSTAEVVERVKNSVVEVRTELSVTDWGMQYVKSGAGSGVIVAGDDTYQRYLIVTNNHVVDGAQKIEVVLRTGDKYNASLVATDVPSDIAVLEIKERSVLTPADFGRSDTLQVGEDVIAIGNPLGSLPGSVTKGIISSTERSIPVENYTMTLLQTDTAINPGNSGGGLFNMRGELVGIVNAKTTDETVEGICFAIPSNTVRKVYDDLVKNGVVTGRVTLGINVKSYDSKTVYVSEVTEKGSPFTLGDRITKINGAEITSMLSYNNAIADLKPDQTITVEVHAYLGSSQGFFGTTMVFDSKAKTITVTAKQLAPSIKA